MSMGEIVPTVPLGGGYGGFGGGDALAAGFGAFVGSWLGNGWNGNGGGWNRGGWGGNGGGSQPSIVVVGDNGNGGGHHGCATAELDALSNLQSSVNAVGLNVIQGQNASNLAACQGFSGVVNASNQGFAGLQNTMNQGFAGINNVVALGNAATQQSLCQGFGGINTAILGAAKDAALQSCQSTGTITSAIEACCCKTQAAIAEQGQLTRDLINQNTITSLQTALCDAKAKNSALESQNFVSASQAAQTAQFQGLLHQQSQHFGQLLASYRLGRIDQRDSTDTGTTAAA